MLHVEEIVVEDEVLILDIERQSCEPASYGEENAFAIVSGGVHICSQSVGAVARVGDSWLHDLFYSGQVGEGRYSSCLESGVPCACAVIQGQHVILTGLGPPAILHLFKLGRILVCQVVYLRDIVGEIVQLPGIVLEVRACV